MAVMLQRVVGRPTGAASIRHLSGVARSHNFYPDAAHDARGRDRGGRAGLGKIVVDGERRCASARATPRFCRSSPARATSSALAARLPCAQPLAVPHLSDRRRWLDGPGSRSRRSRWHAAARSATSTPRRTTSSTRASAAAARASSLSPAPARRVPAPGDPSSGVVGAGMGCPVEIEFAVERGLFHGQPGAGRRLRRLGVAGRAGGPLGCSARSPPALGRARARADEREEERGPDPEARRLLAGSGARFARRSYASGEGTRRVVD